jgi:predicted unusual protein kinase regulating ubiquinone biosynthesis (AarF/ABC1/UbiB family)
VGARDNQGMSERKLTAAERLYRARRIGVTFGRIYLGIKTNQWIARRLAPRDMKTRWSIFNQESATNIFEAAVELRGLILKGCQFLGSRADVLPPEYVEVLTELQDRVPPHPFEEVREQIEEALGAPVEKVFASFDPLPIASASLAQVHEAVLESGERVAVKVQYPGIGRLVRSDLSNLRTLFSAVGLIERDFDMLPLIEELGEHVPRELDFVNEAHNAERIAKFFEGRDDVHVPKIYWEYTSERILVMEFIDGIKITDSAALTAANLSHESVMRTLVELYCIQILTNGFFHADPHPGNLMVRPPREGGSGLPEVVMLDFGLAKQLPPAFHKGALAFAAALLEGKPETMAKALVALGFETRDDPKHSLETICGVLLEVAKDLRHQTYADPDVVKRAGKDLTQLIRENPIVRVPSHVVLVARVFALLSGLGRTLDVRIDMLRTILPYVAGVAAPPRPPRSGAHVDAGE